MRTLSSSISSPAFDEHLVGERVLDVLERHAPEDALADRLDDRAALDERADLDAVDRAAVLLADDHVLRDVDQAPRQVAGVRGLERRVRETLARAVGRDEVLEHREPLAEVRGDRRLDDLARRLRHQTAHAGELAHLLLGTARARIGHHEDRVEARNVARDSVLADHDVGAERVEHLRSDPLGRVRPDVDHLVVALAVGDQTFLVLLLDLLHLDVRGLDHALLVGRDLHVVDADRDTRARRVLIAEAAQPVGEQHGRLVAEAPVGLVDQLAERLLVHHAIDELERDVVRHDLGQQDATRRRVDELAAHADLDRRVEIDLARVVGAAHLFGAREAHALAAGAGLLAGHVVAAEHDVLAGPDDRPTRGGREDVVGRHHQHARFDLRLHRERDVHGHLIAVEVRVERGAGQRMQLDRLAVDQHRLEGLHAQAVQRRRAVEHHRMLLDHLREDVPDLRMLLLHHLLGGLDGGDVTALLELRVDEGLEQLDRHAAREPALVQAQLGPDHDHRAARVVDALAEQVLAEAAGLALQHVRERLERALRRPGDHAAAPAVVEQRVDRLLQHPHLVADDHVRRVQLLQALQRLLRLITRR